MGSSQEGACGDSDGRGRVGEDVFGDDAVVGAIAAAVLGLEVVEVLVEFGVDGGAIFFEETAEAGLELAHGGLAVAVDDFVEVWRTALKGGAAFFEHAEGGFPHVAMVAVHEAADRGVLAIVVGAEDFEEGRGDGADAGWRGGAYLVWGEGIAAEEEKGVVVGSPRFNFADELGEEIEVSIADDGVYF